METEQMTGGVSPLVVAWFKGSGIERFGSVTLAHGRKLALRSGVVRRDTSKRVPAAQKTFHDMNQPLA